MAATAEAASLFLPPEPLALERPAGIEDLNPRVLAVRHQHVTTRAECEPVRVAEFAGAGAFFSPLVQESAVSIEERDAAVHVAVSHVERSVRTDGDVGGLIEMRRIPPADPRLSQREQALAVV